MRSGAVVATVSAAFIGCAVGQNSSPVAKDPTNVAFVASLPDKPFYAGAVVPGGKIQGSIHAEAAADGNGVKFNVEFGNLPAEGGPFIYHIHVDPATNGNCTTTLGHLDPVNRGEKPACDSSKPESCQVGDLSGKYGKVTSSPFKAEYVDHYVSTTEGDATYFGNRSFVIHYANGTRLACANFSKADVVKPTVTTTEVCDHPSSTASGVASGTGVPSGTGYPPVPTSSGAVPTGPPIVPVTGAGSMKKLSISLFSGMAALAMFVL